MGRTLRIGAKTMIAVLERDPRCKMITLDPDTAQANPEVMRQVARAHDGKVGVSSDFNDLDGNRLSVYGMLPEADWKG